MVKNLNVFLATTVIGASIAACNTSPDESTLAPVGAASVSPQPTHLDRLSVKGPYKAMYAVYSKGAPADRAQQVMAGDGVRSVLELGGRH